jgi:hypothetical protein
VIGNTHSLSLPLYHYISEPSSKALSSAKMALFLVIDLINNKAGIAIPIAGKTAPRIRVRVGVRVRVSVRVGIGVD